MFKNIRKIAIANRGEVAVRIIHACHELGLQTVLLHSEVDVGTRAYRMSDARVCIGPAPTAESYLQIGNNVKAAISAGAQAIHPGFGFLSENADFAQACRDAKLIFIGPKPETIRALGDKISAKRLIQEARVPTVPGYMGEDQSIDQLVREAQRIGFPVIVKAAAGGGGRGMKVLRSAGEAPELIASAQREAMSAFGSTIVFLEKYLDRAKHIEFQIFGDFTGRCVHLFDRECSVQRRHQKIIEEAVSPSISDELRQEMAAAAVALAQTAGYQGAGTVEFLVQDGRFYFLEMNTRLQVEHPVTEMVLGVDLVKAQILNAAQEFSLWPQADLVPRGHAIECRLYAEDPCKSGMPSTGLLGSMIWPEGPGRRFEVGFEAGDTVTSFYDPMIAKVIVWDESRPRAIRKMLKVLEETVVFGVKVNTPYLHKILSHPEFVDGTMTTQFIQTHFPEELTEPAVTAQEQAFLEAAWKKMSQHGSVGSSVGSIGSRSGHHQAVAQSFVTGQLHENSDLLATDIPWRSYWRTV